eukprot:8152688-Pyramimonas_sp.AAC.1
MVCGSDLPTLTTDHDAGGGAVGRSAALELAPSVARADLHPGGAAELQLGRSAVAHGTADEPCVRPPR